MINIIKEHKKLFAAIAIGLAILVVFLWLFIFNKSSEAKPKISEGKAKIDSIYVSVENDGVVTAEKVVLNFAQAGTLKGLNYKVGDKVQAGDQLAELDESKLIAQVSQAQSTYYANLEKANRLSPGGEEVVLKQRALDATRSALAAEQNIYNDVVSKSGVGSSQELAEAAKLRKAEADVASAEAQLALTSASKTDAQYIANASYANLQIARTAVYDTRIISPISGIITAVNGAIGQTVGGTQANTAGFITVANPASAVLVSNFDEEDIAKIKVGQSIKAEFTSLNTTLNGTVTYVSPIAKIDQNGAATYEVRSTFDPKNYTVLDGMNASIKFITKQVEKTVVIPNKAVKISDGKSYVSFYDDNRNIATKAVTTGFTDGKSVSVTTGMNSGDEYLIIE